MDDYLAARLHSLPPTRSFGGMFARRRLFRGFLFLTGVQLLLLVGLALGGRSQPGRLAGQQALVRHFALADFCLTTESRHVRHLSTFEPMGAFQDFPGFHDHFPSSSFFWPVPTHEAAD